MKNTSFLKTLSLSFALACLPLVSGCGQPASDSDAPAAESATTEEGSDSHDDHADHEGSDSHDEGSETQEASE